MVALDPAVILTAPEAEQVVIFVPAIAVGSVVIVKFFVVGTEQLAFEAVSVKIIVPVAISATLGLYVQLVIEVASVKVPVPLDVHTTVVKLGTLAPAVMLIAPELEQVVISVPAVAELEERIVNTLVSIASEHPASDTVNVSVTLPAAISAILGLYVQVVSELALAKVPVPLDDQVILV